MRVSIILIGLGLMLGLPTSGRAVDPDTKCYADKVKEAAKYSACRLKAESKAIKKFEVPDFSKCDSKFSQKWQKVESKAEGACPTNGDEAAIQARVQQCVDDLVVVLGNACLAGGARVGGACWYLGGDGESCDTVCTNAGLVYDSATATYAGSGGTLAQCDEVMDALGDTLTLSEDLDCGATLGCVIDPIVGTRIRCTTPVTDSASGTSTILRACACQ